VRTSASAAALSGALALAASPFAALSAPNKRGFKMLDAVHIKASGDALAITANVLDLALTLTVPAVAVEPGEIAVSGERFAALVQAMPATATLTLTRDEIAPVALVRCGRSRFKLATMPITNLPVTPVLTEKAETGRVELTRAQALALLRPAFAASRGETRYYCSGLFLHDIGSDLAAVATDGHRLVRVIAPNAAGLSSDHRLNIPSPALKILGKILADRNIERVTLRRSDTLFAVETARASFVSKLIDGTFPNYALAIPGPSGNSVTVDCAELAQALERVAAMADDQLRRVVGLYWEAGESVLRLCLADSDLADDAVAAETTGSGKTAVQIGLLSEMLEAVTGKRFTLDSRSAGDPLLVTDPDDKDFLAVQMPCRGTVIADAGAREREAVS
jgi:DNA polymerase-3 subunit beta